MPPEKIPPLISFLSKTVMTFAYIFLHIVLLQDWESILVISFFLGHLIINFFKLQNGKGIWHIIRLVRALIVCTPIDKVIILRLCHCYASLISLILNCLDRYEGASLEEDTLHYTPLPAWWKVSVWFYSKLCFLPFCILGSWFKCMFIALQTLSKHTHTHNSLQLVISRSNYWLGLKYAAMKIGE